jgi:hypothetical protein
MNPYQVDVMGGNGKTIKWDNKAIGDVREEKDRYKRSEDLEGMQDILESVILKTSHLPLEFIQNAEDEESPTIGFHLHDSALLIYNDGRPFRIESDRNDIKGFCSIGVSQKYKKGIGFLGVGAKTVFTITKKPWVVSGKYNFTVENMLYPSPRQEFPPFSSEILRKITGFPQRGALFYSPLIPSTDGKRSAAEISEILGNLDHSVIMFLDSVKTVEVKDLRSNGKTVTFRRSPIESYIEDDASRLGAYTCKKVQISSEKTEDSENSEINTNDWIVGNLNINISDKAKKDLPASKLYGKKRASKMTRVSVAIPVNGGQKQLYPLHCYLPLKDSLTGLPFILQGDFIPEADRNHVRTDLLWNREILESLGVLFTKVVQTCSENTEVEFNLPDLVPWEENISPFLDPFVKSLKSEMLKTKFKIEASPDSIDLEKYVVCNPDMRFLSHKDLRPVHLNNHFRLFLRQNSKLRRCIEWIGVRTLTAKDTFKILLEKSRNNDLDTVWVFDCYYSLAKVDDRDGIDEQLLELMRNQRWLFTNKRRFARPHDRLYFRMPKAKREIQHIDDFIEVEFLHPIFTTFSGSYKYGMDKEKRDVIRQFLIKRFSTKILEDEGHLIRHLIVPLLGSEDLSREKRAQHFTALLYYHEKLQKKLMKDSGFRTDFDRGKKRLQDICRNILVPVTTCTAGREKQIPSGLMPIEQVYMRGRRNRPGPAFSVFGKTPGVYFLSPSFQKRVSERIGFEDKQFIASLENIGIPSGLKILEKTYSVGDNTPFGVRTDLVDWRLRDHEVPGMDKLVVDALRERPEGIKIILKELSNHYKPGTYNKGFLEAILRSSRSGYEYPSSVARALDRLELKDRDGKERHLEDFVFGDRFTELIPDHMLLIPFNTKGLDKLLTALQMRAEPSQGELIDAIKQMKTKYEQKGANVPRSEIVRLCKIYQELSNYESAASEIYLITPYFDSQWFKPAECYWSDPTKQFKKYHPVIGDFYKKVEMDDPGMFEKFGVNPFPSVEDIFSRISALRKNINKKKGLPSHEEINELRCYYKYLEGKEIPDKLRGRKIFLTDSGIMVDANVIYISRNIELHRVLSREVPELILNRNLIQGFPEALEKAFGIKMIESTISRDSLPSGAENHDLTFLLKLLLKMVATYEYDRSQNAQETHLTDLQELSESIKVVDTEKIELASNLNGSLIRVLLDTLFMDNRLYLTDIRDRERLLSRIREYGLATILKGCSNDTINFASQLIAGGLDIDSMQESFFKQGFSRERISRFLEEMRITEELRSEEAKGDADDASEDEGVGADTKEHKKEDIPPDKKRKKEADKFVPDLANPFEYEIEEIKESKTLNGKGKEIGFRKRGKVKVRPGGPAPPPPALSNLGVEETGIEFVKMACRELFGIEKDDDIKDVHRDLREYDILLFPNGDKKYIELKASLSDPATTLTRDEFAKAKLEKENYYLFLVRNIRTNAGDVNIRYIQNPASHKHVRLGGARLKDINWKDWGTVKFGKKAKQKKSTSQE